MRFIYGLSCCETRGIFYIFILFPCVCHILFTFVPKQLFMWFFGKNKKLTEQSNDREELEYWKEKYMSLLMTLGDMYPYGMIQLLSEIGEERNVRWNWNDWCRTIRNNQNYIFKNINRLKQLEKKTFYSHGEMRYILPLPEHVLQNVSKVRSMVEGWERTEQLKLPFLALTDYIPARIRNTDARTWESRNLVCNFKCDIEKTTAQQHAEAIQTVLERMRELLENTFGNELQGLTLVCIPASSAITNDVRYAEFAERLCRATKMVNAHGHIRINGTKTPKHLGKSAGVGVELDREWFRYRKILFFDDIITTGRGYEFQAGLMREARAFVIGAVFIGHTIDTDKG